MVDPRGQPTILIAYCGLYCTKCYKMRISEAAELLKDTLKDTHIRRTSDKPSTQFKNELNNLTALHCPKLCKDGGGNPNCQIRRCCTEKILNGCWELS